MKKYSVNHTCGHTASYRFPLPEPDKKIECPECWQAARKISRETFELETEARDFADIWDLPEIKGDLLDRIEANRVRYLLLKNVRDSLFKMSFESPYPDEAAGGLKNLLEELKIIEDASEWLQITHPFTAAAELALKNK